MVLNLKLRTAGHVLFEIDNFQAGDPEVLYKRLSRIAWEDYLLPDNFLSVDSSVRNPLIRDSRFVNQKAKDAIVDRLKTSYGRRPDSGPEKKGAVVYIYWVDTRCLVYLDTSGESLSRRGYRKMPFRAPVQETLAAAIVMETGWDGTSTLINPMCGSGTIAIEAALLALRRAPGLLRGNFGFMHINGFPAEKWNELRRQVRAESMRSTRKDLGRIIATDISREAIKAARHNASTAGVDHLIEFSVCDFSKTAVPEEQQRDSAPQPGIW